jgi:UDP-3-O-[3-hydroxymyristoyl] glucosamine N-acyltransferase
MADSRFFNNQGPFSVADLARIAGDDSSIVGDAGAEVTDVSPLGEAGPGQLSFLDNRKYVAVFEDSRAEVCIVASEFVDRAPDGMTLIVSPRPYRAYARVAKAFYPGNAGQPGIHATAFVDNAAEVAVDAVVGPNAVVEADASVGSRVVVGAGAVIGRGVTVGDGTEIGPGASLSHCDVGARCQIHAGARIGTRGFGFDMSPEGHLDVPQLGRVIVGNDVEIGANSTIDRGSGPDTEIGDGCKIDNLVQIGHNVRMGCGCVVVAQAGVAGSARLQDFVVLAAQSGVAGHITIAAGTQLAARSGIMRDTEPGAKLAGNPAIPAKEYFRQMAVLSKLAKDRNRKD